MRYNNKSDIDLKDLKHSKTHITTCVEPQTNSIQYQQTLKMMKCF